MRRLHEGWVRAIVISSSLSVTVFLNGCATFNAPLSGADLGSHATTDHSYALLYDLMGDEGDVSKLLIIKRVRPELKELIKEISARCSAAHKEIEAFAKMDRSIKLKNRGLPMAEIKTRESISSARGKHLLGSKGKEFELELLLTQNEALTYGAHLARVTANAESKAERIGLLKILETDISRLQQRLVDLMANHYSDDRH
jgi:hypothetical protein